MYKTGFIQGRFCGSFSGCESKVDKAGVVKSVVTFMTMKGKKYRFTVLDECPDFSSIAPFAVITVDVTDAEIGKAGEFGNYGDQNFTVTNMKISPLAAVQPGQSDGRQGVNLGPIVDKKAA